PLDSDPTEPKAPKDPAIYQANRYYPDSPVKVSRPMKMRGVDCVILGICPFQYNPVTKELIVYKDLRVRVDFIGGNGHFGDDRYRNRFFEPLLRGHLINYSILPKVDLYTPRQGEIEYAIIVPDDASHEAWAETIKAWRQQQGIVTEIYRLSQIGGNNATLIERFLDSLYAHHQLSAFLLLSDYQSSGFAYGITSPVWGGHCVSDNKYADTDGDSLPDMFHGRITSQNETHLSRMVGKMLSYERQPPTDPRFYNRPLLACCWETPRWFMITVEILKGYFVNELGKDPVHQHEIYFGSPYPGCPWSSNPNTYKLIDYFGPNGLGYIDSTNPHNSTYWDSGDAGGISREINTGVFLVQHRDHGAVTYWVHPYYHISHINGLTNDKFPFVFSINCLTGQYNNSSQCFTEAFHRHQQGALGLVAASASSYSFVNDTYIFGMYDAMFPAFMPDYPYYNQNQSLLDSLPNLRPAFGNVSGKYFLHQSDWPYMTDPWYWYVTYHLFHHHGDPFITLFSEVPESLTVSHANQIEEGDTIFTVTANLYSTISLTVDNQIIGRAMGTGAPVDIRIQPQTAGDTVLVTVTLYNHYRYMKEVPVVTSGIAEESKPVLESRIWLDQNIVQGNLVINYILANKTKVKIILFDATGRRVDDYEAVLTGKGGVSFSTNRFASGVYFVRIERGNRVQTHQVILVR
ncbi:MAG TPA: T9SS type A sorting domain-containing protein, partial [bacterium (Candidatus Stahlbacteria)]|nr:T9SS type A sorting domain-containing protein [Candidatus Stahlbacteria bacterium]